MEVKLRIPKTPEEVDAMVQALDRLSSNFGVKWIFDAPVGEVTPRATALNNVRRDLIEVRNFLCNPDFWKEEA